MDKKTRHVPTLVFTMEQYDRFIIQLSNKSKVNLTKYSKRSTVRDFRIQIKELMKMDEGENDESEYEGIHKKSRVEGNF